MDALPPPLFTAIDIADQPPIHFRDGIGGGLYCLEWEFIYIAFRFFNDAL